MNIVLVPLSCYLPLQESKMLPWIRQCLSLTNLRPETRVVFSHCCQSNNQQVSHLPKPPPADRVIITPLLIVTFLIPLCGSFTNQAQHYQLQGSALIFFLLLTCTSTLVGLEKEEGNGAVEEIKRAGLGVWTPLQGCNFISGGSHHLGIWQWALLSLNGALRLLSRE